MGAWGHGLQSNDSAWDAIGHWGFDVHGIPPAATLAKMRTPKKLKVYFDKIGTYPNSILGLADYLLDAGVNLAPVHRKINRALKQARTEISEYRNPVERRAALDRFANRLAGEPFDKTAHTNENKGLMTKIAEILDIERN